MAVSRLNFALYLASQRQIHPSGWSNPDRLLHLLHTSGQCERASTRRKKSISHPSRKWIRCARHFQNWGAYIRTAMLYPRRNFHTDLY